MEIPVTKLREFYKFLRLFSTETELKILEDFNRGTNYKKLVEIFEDSKKHFKKYCSVDTFTPSSKRKVFPPIPSAINSTNDVVSILENKSVNSIINNNRLDFTYIEREISPLRTPGGVLFETGKSGKSSGAGGLDFIGWNIKDNLPILGEIKVKMDENPFFAIIQLLTYLSELSTPNQIKRINYTELFGKRKTGNKFYLYILMSNYGSNPYHQNFLKESKNLAKHLQQNIKEVKEIVFLELDSPTGGITQVL